MRGRDATMPQWIARGAHRLRHHFARRASGRPGAAPSTRVDPPHVDPTPAHRRPFATRGGRTELEQSLSGLVGRLRLQDAVVTAPSSIARAAVIALAAVAVARAMDLALAGLVVAGVAGTWATAVLVRTLVRRIGPFEAARRADFHLGLRAQLATGMELVDAGASGEIAGLQVFGATGAARAIIPGTALPAIPADPRWRRDASVRTGTAVAALLAAGVIVAWPPPDPAMLPNEPTLVLADARAAGEALAPTLTQPSDLDQVAPGDLIEARGARPGEAGAPTSGLLGQSLDGDTPGPSPNGQPAGDAHRGLQDATGQATGADQAPSAAARADALQKLGDALRQAQASRAAGESLRRGDTSRAADQLNQLADQLSTLGPSERETLAKAFDQAAKDTQSGDRQVSDAARQASQALGQFRDNDARDAVRREANAVRQAGDASAAQRDREARASDLARGAQPSLPQGDQSGARQANSGARLPDQSGSPDRSGESLQAGTGAARSGDGTEGGLGNLEQQLRSGSPDAPGDAAGQGAGVGSGSGSTAPGQATRLEANSVPVSVQAEQGDGPSAWRPPRADTPAAVPPPAPAIASGPASAAPIGAGADINAIPREHAGAIRQYFTPDAEGGASPPKAPAPARGLVDVRP